MDANTQAEIEVLFWIVFLSLILVSGMVVGLVQSGRVVPPPMMILLRLVRRGSDAGTAAPSRPGSGP